MSQAEVPTQTVDLTNCDREPIHTPGAIQPHGALLALSEPALRIVWVSANVKEVLGVPAETLLGQTVTELLSPPEREALSTVLHSESLKHRNPLKLQLQSPAGPRPFDAVVHRHAGHLIVELEPATTQASLPFTTLYHQVREAMTALRLSQDLSGLCTNAAREVRRLTGFDRVLIYVFDPGWHGRVVTEEKRDGITSYLGLHFPASDIPAQARALYQNNPLRLIPTVAYRASPLLSLEHAARPLDLSLSTLRNVSPIHIEYLKNMGATASMSISLNREGTLWGLITCTHESGPRHLPYEVRVACELLGEITSSLLDAKEANEDRDEKIRLQGVQTALLKSMSTKKDFIRGLLDETPNLLDLTAAQGAAVYFNGRTYVIGQAPEQRDLESLIEWLIQRPGKEPVITDSLPSLYPPAAAFKDVACGLLACPLSRGQHNFVLWFRPEVTQAVNWGGNPHKPVVTDGPNVRLHPRTSFALWKETVHLRSLPWKPTQLEAAVTLMRAMVDIVLQKSEQLAKLNTELERSNIELDAFAYAASHDLKEPLRGIHNYTALAIRELGEAGLVGESRARLNTVIKLTDRMESLINSLLHYSHVGRTDLSMREVDLHEVVNRVQEMLKARFEETGTSLRIPHRLPVVRGDRVLLGEVFSNLITNALKYNDKAVRWVEVGIAEPEPDLPLTLYVRDNGIGIREKNLETVFKIFRRLHAREKYGGGTGTGLTITKRIIERHGGHIWVESTFGEGTTVYFTLADKERP